MIKTILFALLLLIIIIIYVIREFDKRARKFSKIITPFIFLSVISNISLLHSMVINNTNTKSNVITDFILYMLPNGQMDNVSTYFNNSLIISVALTIIYLILIFIEQSSSNNRSYMSRWN